MEGTQKVADGTGKKWTKGTGKMAEGLGRKRQKEKVV